MRETKDKKVRRIWVPNPSGIGWIIVEKTVPSPKTKKGERDE